MALTKDTPQERLFVANLLLEILDVAKSLNKSDVKALVEDAHKLTAQEEKKNREAKDNIARYEGLVAQNSKELATLDIARSEINNKIAHNQDLLNKIAERGEKLDQRAKGLDEIQARQEAMLKDLEAREQNLANGIAKLAKDTERLEQDKKDVAEQQAELRARSEQIKALVGG